jgi:hypothetical protein
LPLSTEPGQAARLEAYKAQVRQQLNPKLGTVSTPSATSTLSPSVPNNSTETGNVTVTNALVARNETEKQCVTNKGEFIPALVTYDLTAEIYNGTNRIAQSIKVYYDIVSWNKDNNQSGSFIMLDVPANRKVNFDENLKWKPPLDSENKYKGIKVCLVEGSRRVSKYPLSIDVNKELKWEGPLDKKNKYEGVRVRINKVEWLNEDGSRGSNDTRRLFGYWGKL